MIDRAHSSLFTLSAIYCGLPKVTVFIFIIFFLSKCFFCFFCFFASSSQKWCLITALSLLGGVTEAPLDDRTSNGSLTPTQTAKWSGAISSFSCFHGNCRGQSGRGVRGGGGERKVLSYVISGASEYIQFPSLFPPRVCVCVRARLSCIYVIWIFDMHKCALFSIWTHTHGAPSLVVWVESKRGKKALSCCFLCVWCSRSATLNQEDGGKWASPHSALFLSFSLTHTHMHTHARTSFGLFPLVCSISLHFPCTLFAAHAHFQRHQRTL